MKYFNFDQLNPITHYLNTYSLQDQIFSYERWFNFNALIEKQDKIEELLLLIPLTMLLYIWIKMFAWYDRT